MPQLQQSRSLALVVSCTQGKRLPAPEELRVRNHRAGSGRCALWVNQVRGARRTTALRDLYKGQQWAASLALEEAAAAVYASVHLWVVSAGLGLRRAEDTGPGYEAAFTAGPDSVSPTLPGRRAWWTQLLDLTGGLGVRDVRATADDMLVVLSPSYLSVLEPHLMEVDDEGVAIVTSDSRRHPRSISSGGLQTTLGGSDQTLSLRAANRVIDLAAGTPVGADSVLDAYRSWAAPLRTGRTYDRRPLQDDELRQIIRAAGGVGRSSATLMLKQLRRDGFACEQKRFHRLYAETTSGAA